MVDHKLARMFWSQAPKPLMYPKTLAYSRAGVHMFRLSKGLDIFGKSSYRVEVMTVLALLDKFSDEQTKTFTSIKNALDHLKQAKEQAYQYYKALEREIRDEL